MRFLKKKWDSFLMSYYGDSQNRGSSYEHGNVIDKNLPPPDFSSLSSIKKDFYRVHPDIQKKSPQEITKFYQANAVIVHGENVPAGFNREILDKTKRCGTYSYSKN
jgi:hypothetical protein